MLSSHSIIAAVCQVYRYNKTSIGRLIRRLSALSLILLSIIALKLVDLRPNSNFDILHGWTFAGSFRPVQTGDLEEQREPSEEGYLHVVLRVPVTVTEQ
uniref:Secreted protein n=1 Tax=Macrostomum lignano TaxID=282301 RepID=A0A1I8GBN0_9PLAT